MALEEFYSVVGGDLPGVRSRLLDDARIEKFLGIFFADPTFDTLTKSMAEGDAETAFRAAHTLKGISRDMGFNTLSDKASVLTDALRVTDENPTPDTDTAQVYMHPVVEEYAKIAGAKELI